MKLTTIKLAASAPLLAIMLSACGGTDFSNQAFEGANAASKELTERLEEVGGYNAENEEYANRTLMSELPADGQASYTGLAEMWVKDDGSELGESMDNNETPDVIADLKLEADFGKSEDGVTGTLSNWVVKYDPEVGPFTMTGDVDVTGDIEPDGEAANIAAGLTGTVDTTGDGADETLTFSGNFSGMFLGDSAEGAAGTLNGTFSNQEGTDSNPTQVSGTWGAEKDAAAE